MQEVVIESDLEKKTRSFKVICRGILECDNLCDFGVSNDIKPVWASFIGSENELRPFMANLMSGTKATYCKSFSYRKKEKIHLPRSIDYKIFWQKELEGSIATVYIPEFFNLDPGMVNPEGAKFIVLPSTVWHGEQKIAQTNSIVDYVRSLYDEAVLGTEVFSIENLTKLVPISYLFCSYLDRRTRCPLVADGRFYLQLLMACLDKGLAAFPKDSSRHYSYYSRPFGITGISIEGANLENLGLVGGISFQADHLQIEGLLAEEVQKYFTKVSYM